MVFGPRNAHEFFSTFRKAYQVANLGVKIKSELKMDKRINSVVGNIFFPHIGGCIRSLIHSVFETVTLAFMTPCLEYCD